MKKEKSKKLSFFAFFVKISFSKLRSDASVRVFFPEPPLFSHIYVCQTALSDGERRILLTHKNWGLSAQKIDVERGRQEKYFPTFIFPTHSLMLLIAFQSFPPFYPPQNNKYREIFQKLRCSIFLPPQRRLEIWDKICQVLVQNKTK